MASIQKGVGVVWSLVTSVTGTGIGAGIVQSVKYGIDGGQAKVIGADGVTRSRIFHDDMQSITIEVIPSDTTIALAKAANILPLRGADITVVDADDSEIAGASTGDGTGTYICISAEKTKTIQGVATISITMERGEKHLATVS